MWLLFSAYQHRRFPVTFLVNPPAPECAATKKYEDKKKKKKKDAISNFGKTTPTMLTCWDWRAVECDDGNYLLSKRKRASPQVQHGLNAVSTLLMACFNELWRLQKHWSRWTELHTHPQDNWNGVWETASRNLRITFEWAQLTMYLGEGTSDYNSTTMMVPNW